MARIKSIAPEIRAYGSPAMLGRKGPVGNSGYAACGFAWRSVASEGRWTRPERSKRSVHARYLSIASTARVQDVERSSFGTTWKGG